MVQGSFTLVPTDAALLVSSKRQRVVHSSWAIHEHRACLHDEETMHKSYFMSRPSRKLSY